MHRTSKRGRSVLATAGVAAVMSPVAGLTTPVGVSAAGSQEGASELAHCVVKLGEKLPSGEYPPSHAVCFGTLAEALATAGVDVEPGDSALSMREVSQADLMEASVLATHYDGFNRTSSSIVVSGGACDGGYVNLSALWVDRVSSTFNVCGAVRFFDGYDKTGNWEQANLNLASMNNRANSVLYAQ